MARAIAPKPERGNRNRDHAGQNALPAAADLDSLKDLEHQIQIARAKWALACISDFVRSVNYISQFDETAETLSRWLPRRDYLRPSQYGEIQLDIDDIAEISLTGGEESARAEAAQLQIKWAAEAEPVLRRVASRASTMSWSRRKGGLEAWRRSKELRRAAAALDQRIADQRDWGGALAERRRDLANAEAGSAGKDRQKFETVALKLRIDDLEATKAHLTKLNAQRPKLIERERILGGELLRREP